MQQPWKWVTWVRGRSPFSEGLAYFGQHFIQAAGSQGDIM